MLGEAFRSDGGAIAVGLQRLPRRAGFAVEMVLVFGNDAGDRGWVLERTQPRHARRVERRDGLRDESSYAGRRGWRLCNRRSRPRRNSGIWHTAPRCADFIGSVHPGESQGYLAAM